MILNGRLTIVITIGSVLRESFGVPLPPATGVHPREPADWPARDRPALERQGLVGSDRRE